MTFIMDWGAMNINWKQLDILLLNWRYFVLVTICHFKYALMDYSFFKAVGYRVSELRAIGFSAAEVMTSYTPGELLRAGYHKEELKPLGLWPHDGEWQNYNQYWQCCLSLDKQTVYCAPTMTQMPAIHGSERSNSFMGSLSGSLSGRRPSR